MNKNLLIIESPNKIETIGKYLKDKDFKIMATIGHIRDLSGRGMGFDEKTLEPQWTISRNKIGMKGEKTKQEIINEIKVAAHKAEKIWIATDPDREGEAIAWHVYEILDDSDKAKVLRITFNEITKPAIFDALEHPRKIDIRWVQSQFARRILDRLVGYKLSKIVRQKLKGTSAGRVQTVALKFVYDREKEIAAFKEKKWWTLDITLDNEAKLVLREVNKKLKNVKLVKLDDEESGSGIDFTDEASAKIVQDSLDTKYKIYAVDEPKQFNANPREPYKTSTMQQDAINKLGWNVGKATMNAQHLYEGIKINGEHTALISYPRTDSTRIAASFVGMVKTFIVDKYGAKYYQERTFGVKKNGANTQDAHEAIRVIDPEITPESLKTKISHDEYALYKIIWTRTIAAFMTPARYETKIVRLINNDNKFYTYGRKLIFDGFKKIYQDFDDKTTERAIDLSKMKHNTSFASKLIEVKEHTSMPPPRFNQASLIKALDEAGVGRPSTFKSMANTAVERGYARLDNRAYFMLPTGNHVIEGLQKFFPEIVDKDFTKEMEEHLDDIASKDEKWKEWILGDFKPQFDKELKAADAKMVKIENEQVGRNCPKCGAPLVYRYSKRTGTQFIGCSAFPKCKYAEFPNSTPPKTLEDKCPLCGKNLVQRNNRRGQPFIGCSGYPKCHYIRKVDKDGNILNPTGKEDLKSLRFKKTKKIEPAIVKAKKTIKKTKINKVK